jgi:hypothetical protein
MSASKDRTGPTPEEAASLFELNGNAARAIAAATAQIDLALREAHAPVDSLGQTLERIAEHMQELRGKFLTHTRNCGDAQGMLEMDLAVERLAGEMAVAIQNMQFFDRMFQHLTHVHDYLTGGADNLARVASVPDAGDVEEIAKRWESLRERLFSRLLSDAQRQVLDIVLPPQYWQAANRRSANGRPAHAGPGDIELF